MINTLLPDKMGSYKENDVIFLLRDISKYITETKTEERESFIQGGRHYSEMLPIEYQPNEEYVSLFHKSLNEYSRRIAIATGVVAEQIVRTKGLRNLVLVSLARAGTPIGVLIKRYIEYKYEMDIPHYSISIIRDRGIDEVAIDYIFTKHKDAQIQFIDGWTGKGAITKELENSCIRYNLTHSYSIDSSLAVLADPGHCASIYGTREDFLIPSACLNSTVSGLVSRTVLNYDYLEKGDFHGAKFYKELANVDLSNVYVDTISGEFPFIKEEVEQELASKHTVQQPLWTGLHSVKAIQEKFNISSSHFVKPGVGETTRVLLRRVPWKILINPNFKNDLTHILILARERNVQIEEYTDMAYSCCGIIKEL